MGPFQVLCGYAVCVCSSKDALTLKISFRLIWFTTEQEVFAIRGEIISNYSQFQKIPQSQIESRFFLWPLSKGAEGSRTHDCPRHTLTNPKLEPYSEDILNLQFIRVSYYSLEKGDQKMFVSLGFQIETLNLFFLSQAIIIVYR